MNAGTPTKIGGILLVAEEAQKALNNLDEVTSGLYARLAPVMAPESNIKSDPQQSSPQPVRAPLEEQIFNSLTLTLRITEKIERIISRLEV